MAYLNDPRENRFGPKGEVWENDNRVETRYYWNGAFVDLCDLPPSEYAKTIFHTEGSGGSGGGGGEGGGGEVNPPVKVQNKIRIEEKTYPGKVTYQAFSDSPVSSSTTVTVNLKVSSGNSEQKLIIPVGNSESNMITTEYQQGTEMQPRQESVKVFPESDNKFEYGSEKPVEKPYIYEINMPIGNIDKIEDADILSNISKKVPVDMKNDKTSFAYLNVIPYVEIPGYLDENATLDQFDTDIAAKSTDISFVTDKKVKMISIDVGDGMVLPDDMNAWNGEREIVVPETNQIFHVWVRRDSTGSQINIKDPNAPEGANKTPEVSFKFIIEFE